jgi:hypothetical protein
MSLAAFFKLVSASIIADISSNYVNIISMCYNLNGFVKIVPLVFIVASLITFSNAILNNRQANAPPCQTPLLKVMGSDDLFFIFTRH